MAIPLKQSTASQEVAIGPALLDTDGKSIISTLTNIDAANIYIHKTGAATLVTVGATAAYSTKGCFVWTADATDTATAGPAVLWAFATNALPLRAELLILPSQVYDSLVAGTDDLQVDIEQIVGVTVAGDGSATPWGPA